MQIVTDSAVNLSLQALEALNVHSVPLSLTLDGKTYRSRIDLQPEEFYAMLEKTDSFPTTSQPSAGDFANLYRQLAQTDPDILSIHISSGLSGTLNAAQAGAEMVPEAKVTFFDTMSLSVSVGWMVQLAAYARQAGWSLERILEQLRKMRQHSQVLFTLGTLRYLIHGGRISHIRGLVASVLNIKPIIGPEKEKGMYTPFAQEMSLKRALNRIPDVMATIFPAGKPLRVQLVHGQNPEGIAILQEAFSRKFICQFDPITICDPVLGAHTGGSLVGAIGGDPEVFAGLF